MSRVGRKPIPLPEGVQVTAEGSSVTVKGTKGELSHVFPPSVHCEVKDGMLEVMVKNPENRSHRAYWGLARALIANMVHGVSEGFVRRLEIQGVGYRAEMKGSTLVLHVGYSHPVEVTPVDGVELKVEKNIISVSGIDKQRVGEMAANIRKVRKPEPYKGKGIRYEGEHVRQKAGKVVKASE